MMKKVALTLVMVASLAVPAGAAEPFVALVDLEHGLLLIPEGTAVPKGVEFYLEPETAPAPRAGEWNREGVADRTTLLGVQEEATVRETAAPRRLVYAYAPAEKFVAARKRIQETEPHGIQTLVANMDQFYYFYFYDGSYHGARKYIHNNWYNDVSYGVQTLAFTSSGDFGTKTTVSQSSSQYTYWTVSNSCWFYSAEGTCSTPIYALQASPTFTASISSRASLVHYLYPPCDLPCKENLSSTIVINFP